MQNENRILSIIIPSLKAYYLYVEGIYGNTRMCSRSIFLYYAKIVKENGKFEFKANFSITKRSRVYGTFHVCQGEAVALAFLCVGIVIITTTLLPVRVETSLFVTTSNQSHI